MADVQSQIRRQIEMLKIELEMLTDPVQIENVKMKIRELQRQQMKQSVKTAFGSD